MRTGAIAVAFIAFSYTVILVGLGGCAYMMAASEVGRGMPVWIAVPLSFLFLVVAAVGVWSFIATGVLLLGIVGLPALDWIKDYRSRLHQRRAPTRVLVFEKTALARVSAIVRTQWTFTLAWNTISGEYSYFRAELTSEVVQWCQANDIAVPNLLPATSAEIERRRLVFADPDAALAFKMRWA